MAEELDGKIGEFNTELDKLSLRIQDLGKDLKTNLAGKLNDSVMAAKRLSDPLKDAASITKELNKLADKNESLIIKKKIAEEAYIAALKTTDKSLIKITEKEFKKLNAQLKITTALEDQIRNYSHTLLILHCF